jgi:hypothetical protein
MIASEWNALQSPNNKVLGPNGVLMGNNGSGLVSPTAISNMAAWYDLSDTTSLIKDSSDRIQLIEDKSGLSEDNALVLPGVSGNYASFPALTAFGTGDFSVSMKVTPAEITASNQYFIGGASSSFGIRLDGTTESLVAVKNNVAATVSSDTALTAFNEVVIGYTRTGTTGTYYLNGVADGVITDSNNYTVGSSELGLTIGGTVSPLKGNIKWARVYSTALDATAMAEDAAGTVQANNTFDMDFTLAAKLATSVTASTGQTVTINQTATALPARIHGARDLYMGSASDQPKYLGYDGTNYGYLTSIGGTYFESDTHVDLTGDVDLISFIRIESYFGTSAGLIGDGAGSSVEASFKATSSGTLSLTWREGGITTTVTSSAHSVATGTDIYFRAKRVNNDGGIYKVYFYKSTDGSSWTLISSHNGAGVAAPTSSTNVIDVGGSPKLKGLVYKAEAWQGDSTAGGTLVADFNPADYTSGATFTSSTTGETWTVSGGAHIVTRTGAYFDGKAHYMKSAPFSLSQPENVYLVGEQVNWANNDDIFEAEYGSAAMRLGTSGTSPNIVLGTNTSPLVSDWLIKTCAAVCALFNSASSELRVNRNAAAVSDIGTANGNGFTLAARANGRRESNIFVCEILIYDTVAHDTATQDLIALYAGNKWGFSV